MTLQTEIPSTETSDFLKQKLFSCNLIRCYKLLSVSFEPSVCTGSLPNAVLEPYCLEHPSFGWCKFSCQDGYRRLEVPAAIHNRRSRVEDYAVFLTLLTCSNGTWVTWYEDRAYGINDLCLPEGSYTHTHTHTQTLYIYIYYGIYLK